MAIVPNEYADPGRAAFEELDTYTQSFLLAGNDPVLKAAYSYPLDNDTTFAQFAVVGLDGSGNIALATQDNTVRAIGVMAHAATLGPSGNGTGPVWYSGAFNMDALVWDTSFTTDAQKEAAFRGAPTPTTIIIAKRNSY